ncbi:MAG: hypothetical protein HXX09_04460 [Bacteroidetes bacterium]|nr:hypothetical protein [Bacteroidota bacterium]
MKNKANITKAILFLIGITFISGCIIESKMVNAWLPKDSRPYKISFPVETVNSEKFELIAKKLKSEYALNFKHIDIFRKNGIMSYEGPETCLKCHKEIEVEDHISHEKKKVDLMDNLVSSAHYTFYTKSRDNVYGFNGKLADNFGMGKIDRPCPKPGSFATTAWAEIVITKKGDTLSEGCGQCHIGGQYQAPMGSFIIGYKELKKEKKAIDCLICHAAAYDMNKKQVTHDKHGNRWTQDRTLEAAMSVTKTTSQTCLRCHQHNFGGDIYIDKADSSFMQSMLNTGTDRPRVLHPGSKRGTPYSPSWDVHAKAGINCTECHKTEGHLIAKGKHTTTMMANDLPGVEVSCENCHTKEPHNSNKETSSFLNAHTNKIACVTCHITSLHPDNATRRDFSKPVFEEEAGIYIYNDESKEVAPNKGIGYVWWDGDATFLGNPIGANPNGKNLYTFYKPQNIWPEYKDFNYTKWFEETMRPISSKKPSKLYAMKYFNGRQHIDLQNIGPFGGMFVPYNLPTYYLTGNPDLAAKVEAGKSMMKRMYGGVFKLYMMNKFLKFMYTDGWNTRPYKDVVAGKKVEARWLPADAMLEISHSVRKDGAFTCINCHTKNGVIDFKALGYTTEEVEKLSQDPLK